MATARDSILGANLTETSTTAKHILGQIVVGSDGSEYRYVKASSAVSQYSAVIIDDDFTAASMTTTTAGSQPSSVGVAQVAFASGEYGWVAVSGNLKVLAAASCAADVKLYTTATAGVVDDNATSTTLIVGLRLKTANGGSQAAVDGYAATRMYVN